jgi:hypothetical protein
VTELLGKSPERALDAAMNDWQVMKTLKRSVSSDPAADAALTRAVVERAPDRADATKFRQWLDTQGRVLRQVLTPQHLADLQSIAKAAEILNRVGPPRGAVELPKSLAGKFGDVTGTSLPGITASVTNVERGRSNPLYEFFKSGVALWGRQNQRAVDAAWREALTNPDMAHVMSGALKLKQPTPMQLSKMHAYLLTAGLLHPSKEEN